jgi:hypothetical protein
MAPLNFNVSSILWNQTKIQHHQLIQQHAIPAFRNNPEKWAESNLEFFLLFADGFGVVEVFRILRIVGLEFGQVRDGQIVLERRVPDTYNTSILYIFVSSILCIWVYNNF